MISGKPKTSVSGRAADSIGAQYRRSGRAIAGHGRRGSLHSWTIPQLRT